MRGPLRLPLIATALIAVGMVAWTAWTSTEAGRKTESLIGMAGPQTSRDVIDTLDFPPEAFHLTRAQQLGQLVKTDGKRMYLRSVDRSALKEFSKFYWVERIDAWKPGQ